MNGMLELAPSLMVAAQRRRGLSFKFRAALVRSGVGGSDFDADVAGSPL